MAQVDRITALARLEDSSKLLTYARAAADEGDESWEQWLWEYDRGEALIVAVELSIELTNGATERLSAQTRPFFVDCAVPTPHVEQQIAEVAYEELVALVRDQLSVRGCPSELLDRNPLYVHVELDQDVRRSLSGGRRRAANPPRREHSGAPTSSPRSWTRRID